MSERAKRLVNLAKSNIAKKAEESSDSTSESDIYSDSDPPYDPSFISSTDSDIDIVLSEEESPVIPYISDDFDQNYDEESTAPSHTSKERNYEIPPVKHCVENETDTSEKIDAMHPVTPIINSSAKKGRKKILCKYCDNYVTNFERHITRQHNSESQVQEFLFHPKRSKQRSQILRVIKNEAKFKEFLKGNVEPHYVQVGKTASDDNYAPCCYCKQIVAKKYLKRHAKKCDARALTENVLPPKRSHLSAAQTLIGCSLDVSNTIGKLRIKKEVLDRMAPDEISATVKTDYLILAFGEEYLNKHKRAQMAAPCSNKMRELGRLLIEIRRRLQKKCRLEDVLKPHNFDLFIASVQTVTGYNAEKKTFASGSLADHYAATLKQLCDVFLTLLLTKSSLIRERDEHELEMAMKEVKYFQKLVIANWSNRIGSLARKDLNEKRFKKPTVLPLTEDVNKFRKYCMEVVANSISTLKANKFDNDAYKRLTDSLLALVILFNRKRIGDVQYLSIKEYNTNLSSTNLEECLETLTKSEKELTRYYKRVLTQGKLSRSVVILFPPNIRQHIDFMLEIRDAQVPLENNYVFAYPGVKDRWVKADVAIKNLAKETPNLSNPASITGNKLRKQISTVLQILNLNKEESHQFAKFLGHTEKTHDEFYKLSQDVYETAKISKLLMLMDQDCASQYKGKSLSEINIDPQEAIVENDESDPDEPDEVPELQPRKKTSIKKKIVPNDVEKRSNEHSSSEDEDNKNTRQRKIKKPKIVRERWTAQQKSCVLKHFSKQLKDGQALKKDECENLKLKYPELLENKSWQKIKALIFNEQNKRK